MESQQSGTAKRPNLGKTVTQVATLYNPRTWKEKGLWWTAGLFLVTYVIVVVVLGFIWSRSPGEFDVCENALALDKNNGKKFEACGTNLPDDKKNQKKPVAGYVTTATAIRIAETLLDKPGGYLSNDLTPPGVYLDNIPNWEFGALTELRDLTRSLRNDFSRSQTQSVEDKDLQIAEPKLNYDSDSWILPSTESEYRAGTEALYHYLNRLADDKAFDGQFFTRADNLSSYLQVVEKRLGSLAQRLAAGAGQTRFNVDLAGDPNARQSTPTPAESQIKTPWLKIDDVFFEARGYSWALLHTLKALEVDFGDVLHDKNALVSVKQIVRELENTQAFIWSPMILNGTGFGPIANHSLILASYISRANAAIIDLRNLLLQG
ncbi:DUF2333 family protein [Candidatus Contendibacter odensensis]|uniref:DUF2333 domain-containing protein n=1 Tax=Candidatus Contendobacter odensis Run_B_J11 TaxID=1400861 RepID=A0A7U7J4H4_9GAMM|nr:DUF2333 family protein [Candidatus Contendobacter odensis]CDH45620.1 conserved hypothetical protein [Candidatus Contendobacter odensis Run_B_J11]